MGGLGDYCIEWFHKEMGLCVQCSSEVGWGPVGWHNGNPRGPVCDRCMIGAARGLGAVLMAANVLRELSQVSTDVRQDHDRVVIAIMTFMRLYDGAEDWPVRSCGFLEQLEQITARMAGKAQGAVLLDLIQPMTDKPS